MIAPSITVEVEYEGCGHKVLQQSPGPYDPHGFLRQIVIPSGPIGKPKYKARISDQLCPNCSHGKSLH